MKFSTNEDIEAPIEATFSMFTDFDNFERSAIRRGAEVHRTDKTRRKGVGMTWLAKFEMRGKTREVEAEMVEYTANDTYTIEGHSSNLVGFFVVEMVPLSKSRTRVSIALELKPKSLSGRLMLQTLKLGKTRMTRAFKVKAAAVAKDFEDGYKRGTLA